MDVPVDAEVSPVGNVSEHDQQSRLLGSDDQGLLLVPVLLCVALLLYALLWGTVPTTIRHGGVAPSTSAEQVQR